MVQILILSMSPVLELPLKRVKSECLLNHPTGFITAGIVLDKRQTLMDLDLPLVYANLAQLKGDNVFLNFFNQPSRSKHHFLCGVYFVLRMDRVGE